MTDLPQALSVVGRALPSLRKYIPSVPFSYAKDVFQNRPHGVANTFMSMGRGSHRDLQDFAATIALFVYGRACSDKMYTATAALGGNAMRRAWRYAAKRNRLLSIHRSDPRDIRSHIYTQLSLQVAPQRTVKDILASSPNVTTAPGLV